MSLSDVKVDDTIVLDSARRHGGPPVERTVTKVGRKYLYVEGDASWEEVKLDRDTGIEQTTGNYARRGYTREAWDNHQRAAKAAATVKSFDIEFSGYRRSIRWTDDNTIALAEWLTNRFGDDTP